VLTIKISSRERVLTVDDVVQVGGELVAGIRSWFANRLNYTWQASVSWQVIATGAGALQIEDRQGYRIYVGSVTRYLCLWNSEAAVECRDVAIDRSEFLLKGSCGAVARRYRRQMVRTGAAGRDSVELARFLIIAKDEYLVLLNRTAKRTSVLILPQNLSQTASVGVLKKAICVEVFVTEELPKRAMKCVSTALGDHIHIRSWVPPEASIVGRGLDLELLERVRIRNRDPAVDAGVRGGPIIGNVVRGNSINLVVVLTRISAVRAKILRLSNRRGIVDVATYSSGSPTI